MKKIFNGHANEGGVYKITNTTNSKSYIGSAKNFKKRAYQHTSSLRGNKHQNKHLQASWNKWGEDAFLFEVIEVVNGDKGERYKVEQKYIDDLIEKELWERTFNFKKKTIQKERSSFSNKPEITREKLSKASKKRWQKPNARENASKIQKALWQDPMKRQERMQQIDASRDKLSKALIGNQNALGHTLSKKTKEAISKNLKNNTNHLGHKHTKKTKKLLSNLAKKQWENTKLREEQSKRSIKLWSKKQHKDKMKEIFKKRSENPAERQRLSNISAKTYLIIFPEGKEIEIKNLKSFCRERSLNYESMVRLGTGKQKNYKGWSVFKI